MLNRTYWKSILRTVRASLSRFVAIFAIVALGVGFLSGLLASPVDMRLSTDTYCREANLYDIKIQSTQGLTDEDLAAVRAVEGVEGVMPARDMDLVLTSESGESLTTRLQSIPEEDLPEADRLNQLTLVEGRMPSAPGEIAVGLTKDFSGTIPSIGDVLTVNQTENDENVTDALPQTFTVVGTVRSAAYFSVETEYTNAGTGTIDLFAYAPESSFDMDYYTTFYLSVEGAKELNSFSAAYEEKVGAVMDGLEAIKDERVQARYDEIIDDAEAELDDAWAEYNDKKAEAEQELADGKEEILDAESEVRKIEKGKWVLGDRSDNTSFSSYGDNADKIAAIATVYIVLGILYESYVHPLTILSTLPSAGVGALLALELFNAPFSLIALIGIMLLIGIVKKNAIMMVDFALEAQRHGNLTPQEAIFQACLLRFRPIMMTTLAALFGALPLVLSGGDGSELRQPLGITIVGGLVMSQLLTLYTTPVVYLFFDRLRLRFSRKPKQTVTE